MCCRWSDVVFGFIYKIGILFDVWICVRVQLVNIVREWSSSIRIFWFISMFCELSEPLLLIMCIQCFKFVSLVRCILDCWVLCLCSIFLFVWGVKWWVFFVMSIWVQFGIGYWMKWCFLVLLVILLFRLCRFKNVRIWKFSWSMWSDCVFLVHWLVGLFMILIISLQVFGWLFKFWIRILLNVFLYKFNVFK